MQNGECLSTNFKKNNFAIATYDQARINLPRAVQTSDLGSDAELGRGKRKRIKRISQTNSDISTSEDEGPRASVPQGLKLSKAPKLTLNSDDARLTDLGGGNLQVFVPLIRLLCSLR
jgi:hypothetical protein